MKLIICDKEQEVITISQSQLKELLLDGGYKKNVFVYGKSGIGKSAIIEEYALENDLKVVVFSLATEMPEAIGGIPHASQNVFIKVLHNVAEKLYNALIKDNEDTKKNFLLHLLKNIKDSTETSDVKSYFERLLDKRLAPILESKGQGYVLFFDEMNQALPEVLNACYSICHPDPKKRNWNGHSLEFAQIVGAGNLSDGTDGTVYLNDLPTPLHNRFNIFEMVSDRKDTLKYLKTKWKNIPQVSKYINELLDNNIPPRDIDGILDTIAYNKSALWISSKIGEGLTAKLYEIQKKVKTIDPAETLKLCRKAYEIFKEDEQVAWAGELITTEEDLKNKFKEILSDEEIASIMKGVEE